MITFLYALFIGFSLRCDASIKLPECNPLTGNEEQLKIKNSDNTNLFFYSHL